MSTEQNEPLALGTDFSIDLRALSNNRSRYTVDQLITALEATTTLTDLRVAFDISFNPTAENNRRIFTPLCRSIANLRRRNEHHPLKRLELGHAWSCKNSDQNGMYLDVFEQFLVAAKRFGISHLTLRAVEIPIPFLFLLEFCRDNSRLRVLEIEVVKVSDSTGAVSWWSNDRLQGSFHIVHLDKLILNCVQFLNTAAAASFGNFLSHLSVPVMELGYLSGARDNIDCKKIVSEFMIPSVRELTLGSFVVLYHVKAALNAATATATNLTVGTFCPYDEDIPSRNKVLENLTSLIRGTAKLQSLTVKERSFKQLILPSWMIEAIEGCATITQLSLLHKYVPHLDEPLNPGIRRTLARNKKLALFVASPSTYPIHSLPSLIVQFDHCPSGRYMLARRLPEVLSFEDLVIMSKDSLKQPTQKKQKRE